MTDALKPPFRTVKMGSEMTIVDSYGAIALRTGIGHDEILDTKAYLPRGKAYRSMLTHALTAFSSGYKKGFDDGCNAVETQND